MEQDQMMSVKDVATFLNVVSKTVYRLIERGELPSYKVGKAIRIQRSDVLQYLEKQKQPMGNGK